MSAQKPIVSLLDHSKDPFNLSIATARTCYSSKGILLPSDMIASEKSIEIRDKVAKSTKKAGHLTTRQHPQFIFTLDKVSRQFVWSFLHSHPFYNSEQVSQRYVEVKKENYYVPSELNGKLLELYLDAVDFASRAYFSYTEILHPFIQEEYFQIYKARANYPDKWQVPIKKKCLEVARYLLPLGTYTYLYHSINGLTLHRYYRLMNSYDVPNEQRAVVTEMVDQVRRIDPLYADEMDDPIPLEETTEYRYFDSVFGSGKREFHPESAADFVKEFDRELGGRYSRLVSYSSNGPEILAQSVRSILGISKSSLNDRDAIDLVLNPAKNGHLTSTLNENSMSPISRALFNVQYSFQKRISHTADSQDQRHRMVPGGRPVLMSQYAGVPDYITPFVVRKYPELKEKYDAIHAQIFEKLNRFLDAGGAPEYGTYLLPNSFPIRFYESGDLLNLHHKWKSRTCYNAQEEIFQASVDELTDVTKVHPEIAKWIKAPCWIRLQGEVKPYCPEGDHYCGTQVWKRELSEYSRVI
ncbi:FAD-dependent thymidylate synthase [Leptospira santarosai]|uniref:Thymidylate synthase ThyX n=1 Tax=Leptospira santarosai str. MOR084 TaxID=1049984 RepID=A0A0E2BQJ1_9LEPT|nr:FAD-dependent thymidylate synthase [Leptospira santarosai]EKO33687.1 thymidylate synthase ThyX [Leptospira santarosai str. MOR084]EKR92870.1 thymidylate synthase ThyX [Leptospira santarosai str. CBC379]EMP04318.1 thymidylate synthase ThyX [Leptospira santarosai str. HAI1380]MDI7174534.1 FAD-dependent thymidylate synthase [Leptospira santarosai]MDI7191137.1 FAD-dependent thymidylate synthase [Leptospira santarosai]